jgi:hypothetical protein
VRDSKEENFGLNAETSELSDMIKAGVIDPAKVTRLALQNAASIVALMLTTEVSIADIKEGRTDGHRGSRPRRRHGRDVLENFRSLERSAWDLSNMARCTGFQITQEADGTSVFNCDSARMECGRSTH